MDVIAISANTANIIYTRINILALFQYLNNHDVVTNLPSSKEDAIIIAAIVAPENNIPIPYTLKYAAHPAINKELSITKCLNFIIYINI